MFKKQLKSNQIKSNQIKSCDQSPHPSYFSEFLVSEAEQRRRLNPLDTEVHELGYDPFSYCGRRVHVLVSRENTHVYTNVVR